MIIAMIANMPIKGYSGGRYHALGMAECLAALNHKVYFVTDAIPEFIMDFEEWPGYKKIEFVLTCGLEIGRRKIEKCDYTIVVPTLEPDELFCHRCRRLMNLTQSQMAIINFETPDWYNEYAENKRKQESLYTIRDLAIEYNALILSSAEESMRYAKKYYQGDQNKGLQFDVWNPAINSIAADSVQNIPKEKRIIAFVRLKDTHKGAEDLLYIINQVLPEYTVVLVVGTGDVSKEYASKLEEISRKNQFVVEIKHKLTDKEKFIELRKAEILLFPTKFEGYGYPPIEASYCDTLCITYDLPVLREINKNRIIYSKYADVEDMKRKLKENLGKAQNYTEQMKQELSEIADWSIRAKRLEEVLVRRRNKEFINVNISLQNYSVPVKRKGREILKYIVALKYKL